MGNRAKLLRKRKQTQNPRVILLENSVFKINDMDLNEGNMQSLSFSECTARPRDL